MKDMEVADVGGRPYREVVHRYYDGSTRRLLIVDEEVPFPEGKLIVSRTDTQAIITHGNQSFVEMSGFSQEEIIGKPHSILRHPDMPAAAFADVWATLGRGDTWQGYVKNLRKDGRYYWVFATAIANIRDDKVVGFTSVRRKPSRTKVNECVALYAKMLAEEKKQ
jgi:aerotaxis receptor